MILYYYMGPEYLLSNITERRIKISRYGRHGALNDPFELTPYDVSDRVFRSDHKKLADDFATKMGLICLSKTRQSPAMWAHYAKNHEGACLEFEVTNDHIFEVKYKDTKLLEGISLDRFSQHVNNKNIKEIIGIKSKDWEYEKEYRLHVPLNNVNVKKDGGLHFMPFQEEADNTFMLKRVFVGYRCNVGIKNIERALGAYHPMVEVIQTRPAFKEFKVVEQKNKGFWNNDKLGPDQTLPAVKAVFGKGQG